MLQFVCVVQGANLLDQRLPDWKSKIDLKELLSHRGASVGTQLFGSNYETASFFGWSGIYDRRLREYGFEPSGGPLVEAVWHGLARDWADVIRARLRQTTQQPTG